MSHDETKLAEGRVLMALERKRVLDFVWVFTLAVQAGALLLFAWLGWLDRGIGSTSRSVLACGILFVLAADLSYRLVSPRAVEHSIYGVQVVGVGLLAYLWTLSGGTSHAAGLAFFVPPLVASGMVGLAWLPQITATLAVAGVWIADAAAGPAASAHQSASLLWLFTAASAGLAVGSPVLSGLLVRLHQRIRSESDLADEAHGTFQAVMRGAGDPIVVVYADTLQVAHASESFYRRMLLDRRTTTGRSLFNLLRFANRERMESMFEEENGVIPFQHVEIGPEPIVANLRFFHSDHEGTRYLHITFEEVTDLYYFQLAFDAIEDPLVIVGDVGELFYGNRAANVLLGDLYVGKPMLNLLRSHKLIPPSGLAAAKRIDRLQIGQTLYRQSVLSPKMGRHAQTSRMFWLQKYTEDEARADRARRDALTGLLNRRAFERDLSHHTRESTNSSPVALALWCIDHFKEICDERGDAAGDALLRAFATALGEQIRPGDGFYRLDGDTFAVVYPGTDLPGAESAVQRLLLGISEATVEIGGENYTWTASVGLTVAKPREVISALMARADEALYSARDGGGSCCVVRDPEAK
jgi:diguanylate cyclase (GGDEF)-like protein